MEALSISNEAFPEGLPVLGLFCLVPLYISLYKAKTYRESFLIFSLQVISVHIFSSIWLKNFHGYAIFTLGASAIGTAFEGGICGVIFHALPAIINKKKLELEENAGRYPSLVFIRIIYFSAMWIFWEWIKSTGAMGYPWGTLFMTVYRWKIFCQIADISGVWGISFLWSLVSALFAEGLMLIQRLKKSQNPFPQVHLYIATAKLTGFLFAITALYGTFRFFEPRIPVKTINVVAVQQNIDPWETEESESIRISKKLTEEKIQELANQGKRADIVLWSEGVLGRSFPRARNFYSSYPKDESLTNFIKRMGVPFIIGGAVKLNDQERKYANAAILFDSRGTYSAFYNKRHLVPFAEGIPFFDNPLMHFFMTEVVGFKATYTSGKQNVIFKIPLSERLYEDTPLEYMEEENIRVDLDKNGFSSEESNKKFIKNPMENPASYALFSTPICFEDSFNDVCRPLFLNGSEIFLNITNDSWSKMKSAENQHFIVSFFRAIEYRIPLVRCTNSGYSAVVDPSGRIICSLPLFTRAAFACQVPLYQRKITYYAKYGDIFAYSLFILVIVLFTYSGYCIYIRGKLSQIPVKLRIIK